MVEFMRWFQMVHSKRWHQFRQTEGAGALYQGRYKAFPVQDDDHFLTVCRYVERNPLRAGLVTRAEEWPWSSLGQRCRNCEGPRLETWPIPPPSNWVALVNSAEIHGELETVRSALVHGTAFGSSVWAEADEDARFGCAASRGASTQRPAVARRRAADSAGLAFCVKLLPASFSRSCRRDPRHSRSVRPDAAIRIPLRRLSRAAAGELGGARAGPARVVGSDANRVRVLSPNHRVVVRAALRAVRAERRAAAHGESRGHDRVRRARRAVRLARDRVPPRGRPGGRHLRRPSGTGATRRPSGSPTKCTCSRASSSSWRSSPGSARARGPRAHGGRSPCFSWSDLA